VGESRPPISGLLARQVGTVQTICNILTKCVVKKDDSQFDEETKQPLTLPEPWANYSLRYYWQNTESL